MAIAKWVISFWVSMMILHPFRDFLFGVRRSLSRFEIELAVAGDAQIIVTRNIKDFKRSQLKFPQLEILEPEEVLNY
jgi:hypothetical protein